MTDGAAVTFVGHDASRTGAPLAMLSLLRWARARGVGPVDVLLCAGGPLVHEFEEVASTTVLTSPAVRATSWTARALRSVDLPIAGPLERLEGIALRRAAHGAGGRPTVVANTVAALRAASTVAATGSRLVCHVHELDHVVERVLPDPGERRRLLDRVDHFVAAGDPVATMLVERCAIPSGRVTSIPPFVDVPTVAASDAGAEPSPLDGRSRRPVVAAVGPLSARKGPDRFVDLLAQLHDDLGDVGGVWIGAEPGQAMWREVLDDLARLGLSDVVSLQRSTPDPAALIAAADVVVSTAREDPFPLALLEAAALGKPVITFHCGGVGQMMIDLGLHDWVVPVGDTLGLRDAVVSALSDPETTRARAATLQRAVVTDHSVDEGAPRLWDTLVGDTLVGRVR